MCLIWSEFSSELYQAFALEFAILFLLWFNHEFSRWKWIKKENIMYLLCQDELSCYWHSILKVNRLFCKKKKEDISCHITILWLYWKYFFAGKKISQICGNCLPNQWIKVALTIQSDKATHFDDNTPDYIINNIRAEVQVNWLSLAAISSSTPYFSLI